MKVLHMYSRKERGIKSVVLVQSYNAWCTNVIVYFAMRICETECCVISLGVASVFSSQYGVWFLLPQGSKAPHRDHFISCSSISVCLSICQALILLALHAFRGTLVMPQE